VGSEKLAKRGKYWLFSTGSDAQVCTLLGMKQTTNSLWSLDLLRVESIHLKTHWILAINHKGVARLVTEIKCMVRSRPATNAYKQPADWRRFDMALERARAKLLETGDLDVKDESE
jgi:hypothetical protein